MPILADSGAHLNSADPNSPGVLFKEIDYLEDYPEGAVVMVAGSSGTRASSDLTDEHRDEIVTLTFDGAGAGMWIHEVTESGFSGHWREWGIFQNSRGVFCATKIEE